MKEGKKKGFALTTKASLDKGVFLLNRPIYLLYLCTEFSRGLFLINFFILSDLTNMYTHPLSGFYRKFKSFIFYTGHPVNNDLFHRFTCFTCSLFIFFLSLFLPISAISSNLNHAFVFQQI